MDSRKICVVTGGTSGIGKAAAFELAKIGSKLILPCRDMKKGGQVKKFFLDNGASSVELISCDFSSLAQVKRLGEDISARYDVIDILVNNAGMINKNYEVTEDGLEKVFAVNHLATFLLTQKLLSSLKKSSQGRIVTVASGAHRWGKLPFDQRDEANYSMFTAYGTSKLANILFTRELAHKLKGTKVTANCMHPGFVKTNLGGNINPTIQKILMFLSYPFARSPKKGAETCVYLCTNQEVAKKSGEYFFDCKIAKSTSLAKDDAVAKKLWQQSEELISASLR